METGETAVWRAVIAQAFADATAVLKSRDAILDRDAARSWLLSEGRDFYRVCDLADLNPEGVLRSATEVAENGWSIKIKGRAA